MIQPPPPSAIDPIDNPARRRLPVLLRQAWYGLNQAFRRRIAHLHLTPDQFTALRTLLENQGVTQARLTALMASDPNTIASLLERMEACGLVERKPLATDRRARCVSVRPAGRRKYLEARDIAVALQQEVLQALSPSQQAAFLTQLAKVADACRESLRHSPRSHQRRPGP